MPSFYAVIGPAVALAGGDKLAGQGGYRGMFRHLGWSQRDMRLAAIVEVLGGALMVPRATRRLGGALVAATSAAVLSSELRRDDATLATARAIVLLVGLGAMLFPGRRRRG